MLRLVTNGGLANTWLTRRPPTASIPPFDDRCLSLVETRPLPPLFDRTRAVIDDDADHRRTVVVVAQVCAGDVEAMSYLYARYSGSVFSYVCTIVRDNDDAADVTQDVFLKLMKVLPQYDARRARFTAWLLRIARNAAIDRLRESRSTVTVDGAAEVGRDDPMTGNDRDALRDALADLTDAQRKVLFLCEHVGLPAGEVGRRLGKGEGAVHTMNHRARLAARRRLLEMDVMPTTTRTQQAA